MTTAVIIRDLEFEDSSIREQAAELLFRGFAHMSPDSWPTMRDALDEVEDSFGPGRISVVAVDGPRVLGWAAAIRQYGGNTWELHPVVVHQDNRKTGVGTAIITEIESRVIEHGGLTLWVGTDDESGLTSLYGQELYPDPLKKLSQIKNVKNHPYEFYERLGFALCGIIPDANGLGKPDIFLAKRVRRIR